MNDHEENDLYFCLIAVIGISCKSLSKKETVRVSEPTEEADPGMLIKPSNEFVSSKIPVTTILKASANISVEAFGNITYDARYLHSIAARISGRIDKLYVHYRFQKISKGQKIMEIYSPEILTAEENLLFLLKNDAQNSSLIDAAKEKLLLLGMSEQDLKQCIKTGNAFSRIPVYSDYNGHIHDAASKGSMNPISNGMKDLALLTEELNLKEGMYLQKDNPF